jgi:phosphopentomutase
MVRGDRLLKRIIIIVLDSAGIGEMPDANKYGDIGSNTLGNIAIALPDFKLPELDKLGLGNIDGTYGLEKKTVASGSFGKMAEKSPGKDTTTGHWEMTGIILDKPFPTYPNGFPKDVISSFEKAINTKTIGNIAASGTEIIKQLGQQHVMTGYPIVYTSADSVFQIAAHENIISVDKLYEICTIAREILKGEHAVGRVIARPFSGEPGSFYRTDRRHDFSLKPFSKTVLDYAKEAGFAVKAVGKIYDIFAGEGITESVRIHNNMDGVDHTLEYIKQDFSGIIFSNLVDFDMLYGHRNDIRGYANALMAFDARMPEINASLKDDDILIITADHGCDPTTPSTDHSREYVPLIVYGRHLKGNINLGIRETFADIGALISEYLKIKSPASGSSFLDKIINA